MTLYQRFLELSLFVCLVVYVSASPATETGFHEYKVEAAGVSFDVYAFRPHDCERTDILVVFHGLKRKARLLRNKAVPIAKHACLTVFAPKFDKQRFPNWRYHRAGVYNSGRIQPQARWTGPILQALLNQLRNMAGDQSSRLFLFGHSAGGQFLSRISAYSPPSSVTSIVVANPSLYVIPDLDVQAPIGFAGLFSEFEARKRLKAYLALPITIYLGQKDTGEKYLVKSEHAMQQGENRLERGRYVFQVAKNFAKTKGWTFNWKLVEAPGVAHSSKGMLRAPGLLYALRLTEGFEGKHQKR
jgi:pimeloyl-ACP methyl ester carboxylesterase